MLNTLTTITDPALRNLVSSDAVLNQAKNALNDRKAKEVENAASDFEAMFLSEMLSHMFETTGVDPMFGGGEQEELWRGMMVQEFGKNIAMSGGIGLADTVKAQMLKLQEAADHESGNDKRP